LFLKESTYALIGIPKNEGSVDIGGFMKKSLELSNPPFFLSLSNLWKLRSNGNGFALRRWGFVVERWAAITNDQLALERKSREIWSLEVHGFWIAMLGIIGSLVQGLNLLQSYFYSLEIICGHFKPVLSLLGNVML